MKKISVIVLITLFFMGLMLSVGCRHEKQVSKSKKQTTMPASDTLTVFKISKYLKDSTSLTVADFNESFPKMIFYTKSFIKLEKPEGKSKIIADENGYNGIDDRFTKYRRIIQPGTSCKVDRIIDYNSNGLPKTVVFKFDQSDESFKLTFVLLDDLSFKLIGNSSIKLPDGKEIVTIAYSGSKTGITRLHEKFKYRQDVKIDTKTAGGFSGQTKISSGQSIEQSKEEGIEE